MRKILFPFLLLGIVSCKNKTEENFNPTPNDTLVQKPEALGEEIFNGKGVCYTCHKIDTKTVGPSIREIAKIYKEKGASIVDFLQEKSDPIVDPSQYATMQTNFAVTKNLPAEELKALEVYVMSHSK